MAERTPTPWVAIWKGQYIVPSDHAKRAIGCSIDCDYDRDHYAQEIASLRDDDHGRGSAEANAAFIVKAVNAFDDLTAALKEAREFVADQLEVRSALFGADDPDHANYIAPAERLIAAIDAALVKAARPMTAEETVAYVHSQTACARVGHADIPSVDPEWI